LTVDVEQAENDVRNIDVVLAFSEIGDWASFEKLSSLIKDRVDLTDEDNNQKGEVWRREDSVVNFSFFFQRSVFQILAVILIVLFKQVHWHDLVRIDRKQVQESVLDVENENNRVEEVNESCNLVLECSILVPFIINHVLNQIGREDCKFVRGAHCIHDLSIILTH